ncbi:MAG: AraC family transcriptional regulator [Bacteroidia bacterium]
MENRLLNSLKYTAIEPSKLLKNEVIKYILTEGDVVDCQFWSTLMVPTRTEFICFNLNENKQLAYTNNKEFVINECSIAGLHTKPLTLQFSGKFKLLGIQLRSTVTYEIFNTPMKHLSNSSVSLQDLIGNEANNLQDLILENENSIPDTIQTIEKFFIKLLNSKQSTHPSVLNALQLIEGSKGKKRISEIAKDIHTTERTLERNFLNHVGVPPKIYLGIYRVSSFLQYMSMNKNAPSKTFYDFGYFDQSHFIREFKKFAGKCPAQYFNDCNKINNFINDF